MSLPNTYKQVEYIESSGTQYINTGYIPNNNTKVECKIGGWNTGTGQYGTMFGTRLEWSLSGRGFMLDYDSTNSRVLYMFGGGYNPGVGFSFPSGGKHTIEFSLGGVYEDGTLKSTPSSATFTSPVNLYISALNDNGTVKEFGGFKLYSFKIYNSSTLVRDFVPCYRKSDNKPGLYDLVNNVFYTNQGTGEFEYPAQSGKIKKIYVGTQQVRPKPQDVTETYTFSVGNNPTIYKSGYTIKSVVLDGDYYNPSSGWTGGSLGVGYTSNSIGCYFRGGSNSSYMSYSAGKLNTVNNGTETKLYDIQAKNYTNTTTHMKVSIDREKVAITVGSNTTENYLYSSGSRGPHINSILDNSGTVAYSGLTGNMGSRSNLTAVVTYTPN